MNTVMWPPSKPLHLGCLVQWRAHLEQERPGPLSDDLLSGLPDLSRYPESQTGYPTWIISVFCYVSSLTPPSVNKQSY